MIDETMQMPAEQGITPDTWVIVEVKHEGEQFQKILSGWSGSFAYGDSWRMSTRIKEINIDTGADYCKATTVSGSEYNLYYDCQRLGMSNSGIYNELKEQHGDDMEIVKL